MSEEELPLCECGCGLRVTKPGNRYIIGHNFRGKHHTPETCAKISDTRKGVPQLPETCAAISKAQKGVPHSPEHNAALSVASRSSDAVKAAAEAQRGGHDIVKHHHIYDHNDLSKYTMKMTRSQHMSLHRNMQLLGLEIPHINTGYETADELKLMKYIKKIESEV